jgi:tripartite-type tricarboxylate transporter receptor subunit TctC
MLRRTIMAVAGLLLAGIAPASAQSAFPSQPIRLISGLAAGGSLDLIVRTMSEELRGALGQPIVIENKPGANGLIAMQEVAQTKPDGHTLLIVSNSSATPNILARDKMNFDPDTKFTVLAALAEGPPIVLAVRSDVGVSTYKEFIAHAKANPGKLRFASPGTQTGPHLDMVQLGRAEGIKFIHLPQKGAGSIIPALANGDANFALINLANITGQAKAGEVKIIAALHPKRLRDFPEVPTLAELGHPNIGTVLWHAVYALSETPPDALDKLSAAFEKAKKSERVQAFYQSNEMIEGEPRTRANAQAWWQVRMDKMRKLIADTGDAK